MFLSFCGSSTIDLLCRKSRCSVLNLPTEAIPTAVPSATFEEKTGGHRAADSALRRCAETPFVFGPPPSSVGPTLAMALLAMDKLRRWPSPERVNPP